MRTVFYLKTGAIFFSMAVFAIGIIHLVIGGFPAGLLPVPASLPGKTPLVYLDGIALAGAGALMMTKKYRKVGAMLRRQKAYKVRRCCAAPWLGS